MIGIINIKGITLVLTGAGCPEQYDAFLGSEKVGYLRLRHGHFRVDYPSYGGETIYEASTIGDGVFDAKERNHYLTKAVAAILRKLSVRDDAL
jgi:hypothetical protein